MMNSFEEKLCLVLIGFLIREQNKELKNQNTDILSEILKNLQ